MVYRHKKLEGPKAEALIDKLLLEQNSEKFNNDIGRKLEKYSNIKPSNYETWALLSNKWVKTSKSF